GSRRPRHLPPMILNTRERTARAVAGEASPPDFRTFATVRAACGGGLATLLARSVPCFGEACRGSAQARGTMKRLREAVGIAAGLLLSACSGGGHGTRAVTGAPRIPAKQAATAPGTAAAPTGAPCQPLHC